MGMKLAIHISLDYRDACIKEVLTLLESYGIKYKIIGLFNKVILLDISGYEGRPEEEVLEYIFKRSSCVKRALKIYTVSNSYNLEELYSGDLKEYVSRFKHVAIHVHLYNPRIVHREEINSVIDDIYKLYVKDLRLKVDLEKPDVIIGVYNVEDIILVGIELYDELRKGFEHRRAKYRPVFSPFSLHPKLARLMINLSGVREGSILIDPFCGVASIPMEASLLSIEAICIEYFFKWCVGGLKNVEWIDETLNYINVINADSLKGVLRVYEYSNEVYIVTDPPYGRITSTGYRDIASIYRNFIEKYVSYAKRSVFMSPEDIDDYIYKYDLRVNFKSVIPVHRNLKRILYVVERD